jgi:hypothetical protein
MADDNDDWRNPLLGTTGVLAVVMVIGLAALGIGGLTTLIRWAVTP